jgi:anti-sigma factor RsiW
MIDDMEKCDEALLNRYVDGEAAEEEAQRVDRHLERCAACRRFVQQQEQLAQQLRREVADARQAEDFDRLEMRIRRGVGRRPQLRESLLSWKLLLPVGATAALALVFFTSLFRPSVPGGPSAVINSFTGTVSSVMILETPLSHRTVIWYSEEAPEANGTESQKL